jgi:hypothetical protein
MGVMLPSDVDRIIALDAEIAHGALNLRMSKQQLFSTKVSGSAVEKSRLSSTQRMRAELRWIEADTGRPLLHKPGILAGS